MRSHAETTRHSQLQLSNSLPIPHYPPTIYLLVIHLICISMCELSLVRPPLRLEMKSLVCLASHTRGRL